MRSIAAHRDHFVRRLYVRPSVCLSGSQTFLVVTHRCFAGDTCIPRNAATMLSLLNSTVGRFCNVGVALVLMVYVQSQLE